VCFREKLEDKRLLNRKVTDEWKGWMQVMFVMYHYTRAAFVYNEIRVFVSGYVWLTGFGNYMYFTKKKDFTVHRIVSTLIRINLLPFCLVLLNETDYSDYYVVPLHSIFFLLTMACCYVEHKTGSAKIAIFGTLAVLMLCFEVDAISDLLFPNDEMHFRFGLDRYSTWYGIVCAHFLPKVQAFFDDVSSRTDTTSISKRSLVISVAALASSVFALWFWYYEWGFEEDKYVYNPFHPYIMIIPIVGYLVIRSFVSGWYLPILAWVGGITLETYVLQFHLIMCHNVNSILVIVEGYPFINLAVVVPIFLVVSWYARTFTMRVQTLAMKLFERLGLK
jgi:hypothetical protein